MVTRLLLDAGLVGLACADPQKPEVTAFRIWVRSKLEASSVCVADVTRYEVRRELVRRLAARQLARLDEFCDLLVPLPVTAEAWEQAGVFWAVVRRRGTPTAAPTALDADAILAGVATTCGRPGEINLVVTTNVRHFHWFPEVLADRWENL